MLKISFLLFELFLFASVHGQGVVTKLAQKYESDQPALFWYNLGKDHPQIKAMKNAIKKKKPAMQIVAQGLGDLSSIRISARNAAINSSRYNERLYLL